jgi:serine phosphatase RsbU (regulator of sigma subunit)/anti-sigma regulatory factor (Ser/Thr protein kinase)
LLAAERRARAEAERAFERLRDVQSVTEAALAYLDLNQLLTVLLERIIQILGADTAAILLLDQDGQGLVARAAKGLEEEVEQGFRLPLGKGFAGRVAAERRSVTIPRLLPGMAVNPLLYEKGIASLLGVPLIVERRLIGVLHVGSLSPRDFNDDDAELLQLVADRAALAIEHDRLFEQRRIAEVLQRSLLPTQLPQLPGVSLAARYRPASEVSSVGGDWYDVIALSDGRLGIAIGDVVGHGVDAATTMGGLRNGLHAYALEGLRPAEVAQRIARFADDLAGMATYIYGVFDPVAGMLTFVNGSHPRPLLVCPDGTASYLSAGLVPPLGVARTVGPEEETLEIEPGCTLLLYTDGLLERRGIRLAGRHEQLLAVAREAPFDPDLLCDDVLGKLVEGDVADDVALLAIQRLAPSDRPLELRVATRAEELAAIRRILKAWLQDAGADPATVSAVLLASGEACANAMEHAYGPGDQTFNLSAETDNGDVVLTVRDQGRWRPPRGRNRGRGLGLIETFMDAVDVVPSDEGTTVRMRRRLAS